MNITGKGKDPDALLEEAFRLLSVSHERLLTFGVEHRESPEDHLDLQTTIAMARGILDYCRNQAQPVGAMIERHYFIRGDLNGRFYRHFKGGLYQVAGDGTHSETEEKLVIYRAVQGFDTVELSGGTYLDVQFSRDFWCRPHEMFYGLKGGLPRFQRVRVCPACEGRGTEIQHFPEGVSQSIHCQTCKGQKLMPMGEL